MSSTITMYYRTLSSKISKPSQVWSQSAKSHLTAKRRLVALRVLGVAGHAQARHEEAHSCLKKTEVEEQRQQHHATEAFCHDGGKPPSLATGATLLFLRQIRHLSIILNRIWDKTLGKSHLTPLMDARQGRGLFYGAVIHSDKVQSQYYPELDTISGR